MSHTQKHEMRRSSSKHADEKLIGATIDFCSRVAGDASAQQVTTAAVPGQTDSVVGAAGPPGRVWWS